MIFFVEKKEQKKKEMIENPANLNPKNLKLLMEKGEKKKTKIVKIKRIQKNLKTKIEKLKR